MAAVTPLLETHALGRAYGGLLAVRSVDFRLDRGEIRAIIGPNGAGKTSLVSIICGRIPATSGRVVFKGRDITRLRADERVVLGIVYTFQITSIYKQLTVYENVALAAQRRLMKTPLDHLVAGRQGMAGQVQVALAEVGLHGADARVAGSLSYGHQRLLEIAMALAARPEVLALDEPTQGLAPDEIAVLSALIRRISTDITVLLVEHNMQVVLELSRKITVMDRGSIIAEGTPHQIEMDPDVRRVYLGL